MADADAALVTLLRTCARKKDLLRGIQVHAGTVKSGLLETSSYVTEALVSMYAKCGALTKAQHLLEAFPVLDAFSWTEVIAGYARKGRGQDALNCFEGMQGHGHLPDARTYACLLKACGTIGAAEKGKKIHDDVSEQGLLPNNVLLGTALVDMYAKCGALVKARRVLEELPFRDVVSWSALILGYARHNQGKEALDCLDRMQREGHIPNAVTFTSILKACGSIGEIVKGNQIHDEIRRQGLLRRDVVLGNTLVDMYVKCGALAKAQEVLEELPIRDVVSWNTLVGGYAQQGQGQKALESYQLMHNEGILPNAATYVCVLKACGSVKALEKGEQIHDELRRQGFLGKDIVLDNALVDMYAKCGALARARQVFELLPTKDVVSWNALISGYAQYGLNQDALNCHVEMRSKGCSPDAATYACVLKSCGSLGVVDNGIQIHDEIAKQGLLQSNLVVGSALVVMYSKCGELAKARQVLEEIPVGDVLSWSVLISAYVERSQAEEALKCFEQMQCEGVSPDAVIFNSILKACGCLRALIKGEKIHDQISKQGLLENNIVLGNALVDMYSRCGALIKAHKVLEELPSRDAISWNALITGYAQQGQGQDALDCFVEMQRDGLVPNTVTFVCVLKACGNIGAADKGEEIHDEINRLSLLKDNILLGNALVDMYAKCGELAKAQRVLEELHIGDVVSWSTLIAGYAQQGQGQEALECFQRLQDKGLTPDGVTFSSVLNACSHSGLVDEGQIFFSSMTTKFGIKPDLEHYTCIVYLLGHAGLLDRALAMIERMPSSESPVVWSTLLSACRTWGDTNVGRWAFEHVAQVDESVAAPFADMFT